MPKVTIKINNQTIICEEGETIVDVARSNDIFIPTICYLGGCSPTLACKMCMGESGDGKRVYTCNTKAKDGLEIFTNTPQIEKERQMIMQTYDVNHPLECGVCDKSGECELQNLTLYTKVAHQDYALPDDEKHEKSWAQALYDPNLCIVCERCVTTCKDNIGEAKLKAGKADLHAPDSYKDSMLKDPYSVWSKKQKSLIEFVGDTPCVDCGECIAVCPVGALTYKDFSYTANAWELKKTNSTCHYCSMGCHITYETRHHNTLGEKRIYRVSNDFHFAPICGAGRFGFSVLSAPDSSDAGNSNNMSDSSKNVYPFIDSFSALRLGDSVSNEEAMIAAVASEIFGYKLYNESARAYQQFLPYLRLDHTLKSVKDSSTIITIGCSVRLHAPLLQYAINNTIRTKKGIKLYYIHPIADSLIATFSRQVKHISYAPNAQDMALGALLLSLREALLESIATKSNADALTHQLTTLLSHIEASAYSVEQSKEQKEQDKTLESTNADSTQAQETQQEVHYAALEKAGVALGDFSELASITATNLATTSIIVGEEMILRALDETSAVVSALQLLELCGVRVLLVPTGANTAGIARICNLSPDPHATSHTEQETQESNQKVVGIRTFGDVVWDCAYASLDANQSHTNSNEKERGRSDRHSEDAITNTPALRRYTTPHITLPSHQQMNATMTNFENRVLPFSQVIEYSGDDLATLFYKSVQGFLRFDYARTMLDSHHKSLNSELMAHFANYTSLSDYTQALPESRGFKPLHISRIANAYTQGGLDTRGYVLTPLCSNLLAKAYPLQVCETPFTYNALLSYPQNLFSVQNVLDSHMQQKDGFYTSKAHLDELGLQENDSITLRLVAATKPYGTPCVSSVHISGRVFIDYALSEPVWLISPHIACEWDMMYGRIEILAHTKALDSNTLESSTSTQASDQATQSEPTKELITE